MKTYSRKMFSARPQWFELSAYHSGVSRVIFNVRKCLFRSTNILRVKISWFYKISWFQQLEPMTQSCQVFCCVLPVHFLYINEPFAGQSCSLEKKIQSNNSLNRLSGEILHKKSSNFTPGKRISSLF